MRKGPLEDDLQYIAKYPLQYEQLKETTVLVTGATGLIGASIVRALIAVEGIHIIALVRNIEKANKLYSRHELDNIELIVGDITFPINVNKKVDWIFHCAAVTTSKLMIEKPVETLSTAIEGTKNILELARKNKCKSMVYISSMEMYGTFNNSDTEITEDKIGYINPLKVRSNYPESKRLCENMCVAYMREYGVKVKIARLAQTFGAGILPGENRVFAQFAKSVISGRDIVLHTRGLSEGTRTFWYVLFIVFAYLIYPFVYKILHVKWSDWGQLLILLIIALVIQFLPRIVAPVLNLNIEILLGRFLVFFIGCWCGKKVYQNACINNIDKMGILFGVMIMLCGFLPVTKIVVSKLGFRILMCFWGIFLLYCIAVSMRKMPKRIVKILEQFGKMSYELYLTHVAIRALMNVIGIKTFYFQNYVFCILISLFLTYTIVKLQKKLI